MNDKQRKKLPYLMEQYYSYSDQNSKWERISTALNALGPKQTAAQWKTAWKDMRMAVHDKLQRKEFYESKDPRAKVLDDLRLTKEDYSVLHGCGIHFKEDCIIDNKFFGCSDEMQLNIACTSAEKNSALMEKSECALDLQKQMLESIKNLDKMNNERNTALMEKLESLNLQTQMLDSIKSLNTNAEIIADGIGVLESKVETILCLFDELITRI